MAAADKFTLKVHYTAQGHLDDFELSIKPSTTIANIKEEIADIMDAPDLPVTVADLKVSVDAGECEDAKTAEEYSLEKLGQTPLQVNHRKEKRGSTVSKFG